MSQPPKLEINHGQLIIPMWPGEFGWEVMRWIPYVRSEARRQMERNIQIISHARPSVWRLYADFSNQVIKREDPGRGLEYWKQYHATPDMEFIRYGDPDLGTADIVIHARGIRRKDSINYTRFGEVVNGIRHNRPDATIGVVGTAEDQCFAETSDLRGLGIMSLCDVLAGAKALVGCSSGLMHLASLCTRGRMIAWGDARTYFGETLEQRYKVTWNPFDVPVDWITSDDWQPEPGEIISRIVEALDEDSA